MRTIVIHLSESLSVVRRGSEDGNMTVCHVLPTGREVYKRLLGLVVNVFFFVVATLLDFLSLVKNTEVFPVLWTPYDLELEYWLISLPVKGFPLLVGTSHVSL